MNPYVLRAFRDEMEKIARNWSAIPAHMDPGEWFALPPEQRQAIQMEALDANTPSYRPSQQSQTPIQLTNEAAHPQVPGSMSHAQSPVTGQIPAPASAQMHAPPAAAAAVAQEAKAAPGAANAAQSVASKVLKHRATKYVGLGALGVGGVLAARHLMRRPQPVAPQPVQPQQPA